MSEAMRLGEKAGMCEVHVPGRDFPSPWCASCRVSGAVSADHVRCGYCGEVLHMLLMGHHDRTCPHRTSPGESRPGEPS